MSPGQILSDIDSVKPEDDPCCSNDAYEGVSSTLLFPIVESHHYPDTRIAEI